MPTGNRVVIRTSWLAAAASMSPIALIFVSVEIFRGTAASIITVLIVFTLMTGVFRYLNHLELTEGGLEVWWFSRQLVPWQHIGAVELTDGFGETGVRIFNVVEDRSRRLPAPRGAFGVGRREAVKAQALVEQWWVAYRGTTPARSEHVAPDPTFDPYAPPEEK